MGSNLDHFKVEKKENLITVVNSEVLVVNFKEIWNFKKITLEEILKT